MRTAPTDFAHAYCTCALPLHGLPRKCCHQSAWAGRATWALSRSGEFVLIWRSAGLLPASHLQTQLPEGMRMVRVRDGTAEVAAPGQYRYTGRLSCSQCLLAPSSVPLWPTAACRLACAPVADLRQAARAPSLCVPAWPHAAPSSPWFLLLAMRSRSPSTALQRGLQQQQVRRRHGARLGRTGRSEAGCCLRPATPVALPCFP